MKLLSFWGLLVNDTVYGFRHMMDLSQLPDFITVHGCHTHFTTCLSSNYSAGIQKEIGHKSNRFWCLFKEMVPLSLNAASRMYWRPQDGEALGSNGRIKWGHGVQMVPSDCPSTTTCLVLSKHAPRLDCFIIKTANYPISFHECLCCGRKWNGKWINFERDWSHLRRKGKGFREHLASDGWMERVFGVR